MSHHTVDTLQVQSNLSGLMSYNTNSNPQSNLHSVSAFESSVDFDVFASTPLIGTLKTTMTSTHTNRFYSSYATQAQSNNATAHRSDYVTVGDHSILDDESEYINEPEQLHLVSTSTSSIDSTSPNASSMMSSPASFMSTTQSTPYSQQSQLQGQLTQSQVDFDEFASDCNDSDYTEHTSAPADELIDGHHLEHWLVLASQQESELRALQQKSVATLSKYEAQCRADKRAEQQLKLTAEKRRLLMQKQQQQQQGKQQPVEVQPRQLLQRQSKSSARAMFARVGEDELKQDEALDPQVDDEADFDADADMIESDEEDEASDEFDPQSHSTSKRFSTLRRTAPSRRSGGRGRRGKSTGASSSSSSSSSSAVSTARRCSRITGDSSSVPAHRRSKLPMHAVDQLRHAFLELLPNPFLTDKAKADMIEQTGLNNKQIS